MSQRLAANDIQQAVVPLPQEAMFGLSRLTPAAVKTERERERGDYPII